MTHLQDNHTALHIAVKAGKANVVETLLGHGAQVHIRGQCGFQSNFHQHAHSR